MTVFVRESVAPIHLVERHARLGSTGQISCVTADVDARVYLSGGRLAWATSSKSRFAFGRELARRSRIDTSALRDVVRASRRARLSLREALVESKVAKIDEVRHVLRDQIRGALQSLVEHADSAASFAIRDTGPLAYDDGLTFAFDEVADGMIPLRRSQLSHVPQGVRCHTIGAGAHMANVKEMLSKIMEIDGALGCCVVDSNSGMMLGSSGGSAVDLEIAAAGNTEVVRAKRKTMKALGLNDQIDDMLITLGRQYHIIRPLATNDALFVYLVLDKVRGNLAMARHQLSALERDLVL